MPRQRHAYNLARLTRESGGLYKSLSPKDFFAFVQRTSTTVRNSLRFQFPIPFQPSVHRVPIRPCPLTPMPQTQRLRSHTPIPNPCPALPSDQLLLRYSSPRSRCESAIYNGSVPLAAACWKTLSCCSCLVPGLDWRVARGHAHNIGCGVMNG